MDGYTELFHKRQIAVLKITSLNTDHIIHVQSAIYIVIECLIYKMYNTVIFVFFLGNVVLENLKVKENALVSLYWTMLTTFTKFNYMLDIILM